MFIKLPSGKVLNTDRIALINVPVDDWCRVCCSGEDTDCYTLNKGDYDALMDLLPIMDMSKGED